MHFLGDVESLSLKELFGYLGSASGATVLAAVVVAWMKGWIVTGRELAKAEKRADTFQAMAFRSLGNNERLGSAVERSTGLIETALETQPPGAAK